MTDSGFTDGVPYLRLDSAPAPLQGWLRDMYAHREVLGILARNDFQIRYKRAALGRLWAVVVPVLQASVMALIFTKVAQFDTGGLDYPVYVLSGVLVWNYFSVSLSLASTAIADGSSLTDKVWFPRAILSIVPIVANLVTLAIFVVVIVAVMVLLGGGALRDLWLVAPGSVLLIAFTTGLSLVLSALHVYFRDIRFIVTAVLLVWFYVTPVLYPLSVATSLGRWLDVNPMTGVVSLFQAAAVDGPPIPRLALSVSIAATVGLVGAGVSLQRRLDRLFVDRL